MLSVVVWSLGLAAAGVVALGVGVVLYCAYGLCYKARRQQAALTAQGVKGPPFRFLHEANVWKAADEQDRLGEVWMTDHAKHNWVYVSQLVGCTLFVAEPDLVQDILVRNKANYHKSTEPAKTALRPLFGNGLLMSEDLFWKKQRRALSAAFHFELLQATVPNINSAANTVVKLWKSECKDGTADVDVVEHISDMTLEIIATSAFGPAFLDDHSMVESAGHALSEVLCELQDRAIQGLSVFPVLRSLPLPGKLRVHRLCALIQGAVLRAIQARRRGENKAFVEPDILQLLVDASGHIDPETGKPCMDDQTVIDEAITFFFAGHETVATAMTWVLHFLTQNPECMRQCVEEVDRVLGDQDPEYQHMKQLEYLDASIKESLRLHPPFPLLSKVVVKDHVIKSPGHQMALTKDTNVVINLYVLHRHPKYWREPNKFDPTRFLDSAKASRRHRFSWMPFSEGQRSCLGKNFALISMKVMLATILRRFHLEPIEGQRIVPHMVRMGFNPKYGLKIRIRPRTP